MTITKYKPDGIKTLDVRWNGETLRVTHAAQLEISESRGVISLYIYEPVLDESILLAEIPLLMKINEMNESQRDLLGWILINYDEVSIIRTNQLEETLTKLVGELQKIGIIE